MRSLNIRRFKPVLGRLDREPLFSSWHTSPFPIAFELTNRNEDSVSGTLVAAELWTSLLVVDELDHISRLPEVEP